MSTVRKAAYNSKFGLPIMVQRSPAENEQLVATIILPRDIAERIGDAVIEAMKREGFEESH